ncbi:MAG: phosphonate ABC transporter, permease protein PhnE [Candidatus Bipolaricaulota bacterium]|nr:phosphonate ABC transporter, permease protein PhnE [Candidatus Bipolaricaulota bacterium]
MSGEGLPVLGRLRRAFTLGLLVPAADALVLALLWFVGSLFFGFLLHGREVYFAGPWWLPLLVIVEGALLWAAWGRSPGMVLAGVVLRGSARGRFLYWALSHLGPVGAGLALLDREGRLPGERVGGVEFVEGRPTHRPWYRTSVGWAAALGMALALGAAVGTLQIDLQALLTKAPATVKYWQQVLRPNTSLLTLGIQLLIETFFMALMATLFAAPVAAALSFLAARNLTRGWIGRPVYLLVRLAGSITRSVDAVLWAIIFGVWVGMGSFAGSLALWVHSIVDLLKLYADQLESIDPGPVEAVTATGASRLEVIRYAVIPQIVNPYLSFTLYRWDINVRMATVVGLVGGGGIGFRLGGALTDFNFSNASMYMILVIVLVWAIDYLSARLRAKLA